MFAIIVRNLKYIQPANEKISKTQYKKISLLTDLERNTSLAPACESHVYIKEDSLIIRVLRLRNNGLLLEPRRGHL